MMEVGPSMELRTSELYPARDKMALESVSALKVAFLVGIVG